MSDKPAHPHDRYLRTDHLAGTIAGRTARGGLISLISQGLKFAVSVGATAILAHLLSPQDYGLVGMVGVVTSFVSLFKDMGLSDVTVQRPEITYSQISTLFWVNTGLSVAIMLLTIALAPTVAWFFEEPRLTKITVVTALGFVLGGLSVQHEALLIRQMRYFVLSVIVFGSMTVGYAVGITLAWYGANYWALVFGQLAVLAANTLGLWIACGWRPGRPKYDATVKSMLHFGGHVTGYSLVDYFSRNVDHLLIGRLSGAQSLGLYSKAFQLVTLPTDQVNEATSAVTIPALSRLSHSPERYRQAYMRIMEKVALVTMPAAALTTVAADWLIHVVLGEGWIQAAPILVFISVAGLFQPVAKTGRWLLVTQGRTPEMLRWSTINASIAIASVVVGLNWGAVGVAVAYSLTRLLIANPLMFWYIGRTGPVRTGDFYRQLVPFTIAVGAAIACCLLLRSYVVIESPAIGVMACALIIGVVTLFVLCLLPRGRSTLTDLRIFLALVKPVSPSPVSSQE